MNKAKKILALVCCAALLVCISVGATVAYLTSKTDVVQNTFTVGDVVITLDEAEVDIYGAYVDGHDNRVQKNNYKLLPGHTYMKDPTVTVLANSESSYIRAFVTITDYADVEAVLGPNFLPQNFVNNTWDSEKWPCVDIKYDTTANTATYEYRYYQPVDTLDGEDEVLVDLFKEIKVPGNVTNENLAKLKEMEIKVVAHAIQTDGFVDTEDENGNTVTAVENAWASFGVDIDDVAAELVTATAKPTATPAADAGSTDGD